MSGFASMLPILGPLFQDVINVGLLERGNQLSRERAGEGVSLIDTLNQDLDSERNRWGQSDIYGGLFDPSRFGGDQFKSTTDFGSMLSGMRSDLNNTRWDVGNVLRQQQEDPMARAKQAGSFLADMQLGDYQRNELNNISSESRGRLAQGTSDLIGRSLGQGRGLGETRDAMSAMRYNEGIARSNAGDAVRANVESMRNQNNQYRANLQNQALLGQVGTSASLAGTEANLASGIGQAGAGARYSVGALQNQSENLDQTQAIDAYTNMLNAAQTQNTDAWNKAQTLLGMKQQNMLAQANMIAGTQLAIPQISGLQSASQNLLQQQANRAASDQKTSGSLLLVGWGCIDCTSLVETDRGEMPLAGVLPGDKVRGEDGKMHAVIAKDCGTVPEEEQHDMVRICTRNGCIDATPDHVIGGRPAGQWRPEDMIPTDDGRQQVQSIILSKYRPSGDLMLEGNIPYIANGFVVHSNIGRNGAGAYRDAIDHEMFEVDGFMVSEKSPIGVWVIAATAKQEI